MAIVQFSRFKSDKPEEMTKTAKQAKAIFEKHGAEFLRLSRFHTGMWAGEFLVSTRYSSWEVYGKVQEAVAKGRSLCETVGADVHLCRIERPQHRGRHRSLKLR